MTTLQIIYLAISMLMLGFISTIISFLIANNIVLFKERNNKKKDNIDEIQKVIKNELKDGSPKFDYGYSLGKKFGSIIFWGIRKSINDLLSQKEEKKLTFEEIDEILKKIQNIYEGE